MTEPSGEYDMDWAVGYYMGVVVLLVLGFAMLFVTGVTIWYV